MGTVDNSFSYCKYEIEKFMGNMSLPFGEDCNEVIDQGGIPPFSKVTKFGMKQHL